MTKQGQELERAKAILDQYIVAMPVQAARSLVSQVAVLADKVGRQERLLSWLQSQPYRSDCPCDRCQLLCREVDRELNR